MADIFYRGPSMIDGAPIIACITGIDRPSTNPKTGPMAQTFIMREDMPPNDAAKNGEDYSVCGNCIHRQSADKPRTCYVLTHQAPSAVWWKTKNKKVVAPEHLALSLKHKALRIGSYGNPSAVPFEIWQTLLTHTECHTGYEHNWASCDPRFKDICMASVDSELERDRANAMGWRTFRVMPDFSSPTAKNEVLCPNNSTGIQCSVCQACNGAGRSSNIVIPVHGATYKQEHFRKHAA